MERTSQNEQVDSGAQATFCSSASQVKLLTGRRSDPLHTPRDIKRGPPTATDQETWSWQLMSTWKQLRLKSEQRKSCVEKPSKDLLRAIVWLYSSLRHTDANNRLAQVGREQGAFPGPAILRRLDNRSKRTVSALHCWNVMNCRMLSLPGYRQLTWNFDCA